MADTRVVEMVVCMTCRRSPDDIHTNEPATGAHPDSYSPATVSAEESAGVVTWYVALHKPGCRRIEWASGGRNGTPYETPVRYDRIAEHATRGRYGR